MCVCERVCQGGATHRCCAVAALRVGAIHGGESAFVVNTGAKMHTVGRVSGLRAVHIGIHEWHARVSKRVSVLQAVNVHIVSSWAEHIRAGGQTS